MGVDEGAPRLNKAVKRSVLNPAAVSSNVLPSASSHARPAPKPSPTQAGQALRLKSRTDATTPKERPSEERMRSEEMA